jgi:ferredoxin
MEAKVNVELCYGIGICEQACPEVFEIKEGISKVKHNKALSNFEQGCKETDWDCPMKSISIEMQRKNMQKAFRFRSAGEWMY